LGRLLADQTRRVREGSDHRRMPDFRHGVAVLMCASHISEARECPGARLGARLSALMLAALLGLLAITPASAGQSIAYGAYGPEGPRLREQLWIVPSGDPNRYLRATVFRPSDPPGSVEPVRRPLVVINHGTSDWTRMAVSMPVFYWLSRWFVDRGYAVVLPQRRGHGATGGPLSEALGTCAEPDHFASGQVAADDIVAVVDYMTMQPFVAPSQTVVVGVSTGGWASLALASRNPANVRAVVNFAGGRGGHAAGEANAICGQSELIQAAGAFGASARIPTIWFYAKNDSYFSPELAKQMAGAYRDHGGVADLRVLPAYGDDGHDIVDDRAGWDLWGPALAQFLGVEGEPQSVAAGTGRHPSTPAPLATTVSATGDGDTAPTQ
jgi:dienelactone hydrolase